MPWFSQDEDEFENCDPKDRVPCKCGEYIVDPKKATVDRSQYHSTWECKKECGPIVLDNDQRDFLCMGCGTRVSRTRDNPYPEVKHKGL